MTANCGGYLTAAKKPMLGAEFQIPVDIIGLPARNIFAFEMISNSQQNLPQVDSIDDSTGDSDDASGFGNKSDVRIESWLNGVSEDWQKTVAKVCQSDALTKTTKKSAKRLLFGLEPDLVASVEPLLVHVASTRKSEHDFEQIALLAESIAASCESFHVSEQSLVESGDASYELARLSAVSSLLIANRVRSVVTDGSDQHFERIIRSLRAVQKQIPADDPECVLLHQWSAIELPLTIATQLHAIKSFRKDGKRVAKYFVETTRELLDSDGWPSSPCLKNFGPLVASWTRCIKLAELNKFKLGSSFLTQMEWVPEQFIRLHGPDRALLFTQTPSARSEKSFVEFVLELASDGRAKKLAKSAGLVGKSKTKSRDVDSRVEPSCTSEWAGSAMLKSSWAMRSPTTGIDFSELHSWLEVCSKQRLISGTATIEVREDGQLLDWDQGGFEVVCELVDEDINYLELEFKQKGLTLFRQLLHSKNDSFLFFADSVHKHDACEIDYRLRLPLANGINVIRENGTRELYLNKKGKGIQSLVLPLSMPEWTSERCRGLLSSERDQERGIEMLNVEKVAQIPSTGGALYCPIFIDLDPKRSIRKRTWRSLTVAQNLEIVRPEVASAFRVQVDEQQWIFYRSLTATGNRTFMGQNFAGDFYAAQFFDGGKVQELVGVE